MIGIYKIENLINHKVYIGQSIHIERRWKEHCANSTSSVISKAIKKYGKENFSFQILEECLEEDLDEKEIYYIKKFNCIVPNGYNIKDYIEGRETTFCYYDQETFLSIVNDIKENKLSFQFISEKYDITKRLVYYINNGDIHRLQDERYPLREVQDFSKKYHYCSVCGIEISKGAKMCKTCSNKNQQMVDRPPREELKKLIREKPFTTIGKEYGVSDNAIRNWCKIYNLPYKKSEINKINDTEWLLI